MVDASEGLCAGELGDRGDVVDRWIGDEISKGRGKVDHGYDWSGSI